MKCKRLSLAVGWMALFITAAMVFAGCGRSSKLARTAAGDVTSNLPGGSIFDDGPTLPLPSVSPSPTVSPSPISSPVTVVETPVTVYPNGFLEAFGYDRSQMIAKGLGPLVVRPASAVGGNKVYACVQLDRGPGQGGGVLTRFSNRCGAAMNRTPAVEAFVVQPTVTDPNFSSLYGHALRVCYSKATGTYFSKLGGNACNAIPGNSIQAWFPDAEETEFLGYAGSVPGLQ